MSKINWLNEIVKSPLQVYTESRYPSIDAYVEKSKVLMNKYQFDNRVDIDTEDMADGTTKVSFIIDLNDFQSKESILELVNKIENVTR